MDDQFTRLRWVAGNESIDIMKTKHVAVFGCCLLYTSDAADEGRGV